MNWLPNYIATISPWWGTVFRLAWWTTTEFYAVQLLLVGLSPGTLTNTPRLKSLG